MLKEKSILKFMKIFPTKKIGIDLGTSSSLVYVAKEGIVYNQPSLVTLNKKTGQLVAFGYEAQKMVGRTPAHLSVVKPLVGGVISDFEIAQQLLKYFLDQLREKSFLFARFFVALSIPCGVTEVEKKAVEDATKDAGASRVFLIEEPIAAALGARLPIKEAKGFMVVDIGGGTSEIAVISLGGIVNYKSLRIAGDKMDSEIINYISEEYKVLIGQPTAEELKKTIGSVYGKFSDLPDSMLIKGRDLFSGLPKEIEVFSKDVRRAIERPVSQIIESVKNVIEETPPELVADIMKNGIFLSGGGSLLRGIDQLLEKETGVKTIIVNDPLTAVVRGTGILIENQDNLEELGIKI